MNLSGLSTSLGSSEDIPSSVPNCVGHGFPVYPGCTQCRADMYDRNPGKIDFGSSVKF